MPEVQFTGPFPLTAKFITATVTPRIGNYRLGTGESKDTFTVKYVGRADKKLTERLPDHLPEAAYTHFTFAYADSTKAAFEQECRDYHHFPCLDNKIHPACPKETDYPCPCYPCPYH